MNTFIVEFKSQTCIDWFIWESYPVAKDVQKTLSALRARYPGYEWRAT